MAESQTGAWKTLVKHMSAGWSCAVKPWRAHCEGIPEWIRAVVLCI
jgi:hypothetical protein